MGMHHDRTPLQPEVPLRAHIPVFTPIARYRVLPRPSHCTANTHTAFPGSRPPTQSLGPLSHLDDGVDSAAPPLKPYTSNGRPVNHFPFVPLRTAHAPLRLPLHVGLLSTSAFPHLRIRSPPSTPPGPALSHTAISRGIHILDP